MANYIITSDGLLNVDHLKHHGIKGMKWGVIKSKSAKTSINLNTKIQDVPAKYVDKGKDAISKLGNRLDINIQRFAYVKKNTRRADKLDPVTSAIMTDHTRDDSDYKILIKNHGGYEYTYLNQPHGIPRILHKRKILRTIHDRKKDGD